MKRWFPLVFLAACGPATGVAEDASVDALEAAAPLDAPSDTAPESTVPEASTPDVGPEAAVCPDADGDGHRAMRCGGDDCDDSDATSFPGSRMSPGRCSLRDTDCDGVSDLAQSPNNATAWCELYWEREHGERTYAVCVAPQPGRWTYGGCRWCPDGSNSTSPMCVCWSPTEAEHACPVLR